MSVTVANILESKFFRNCQLLAGKGGLLREIQAVTLFDAPDGYTWFRGKEFLVTTGYLFHQQEGLFKEVILFLANRNAAGMGIKVDRYLKKIPNEIIELCDSLNFPLINLPYETAWIDVINAVNSIAINKYILRINEVQNKRRQTSDFHSYGKKIREVIEGLSNELDKPVEIHDFIENTIYRFPARPYNSFYENINLLEPPFDHKKEIVCDKLRIYRITNLEDKELNSTYVVIPILVGDILVAYLVVNENQGHTDHIDLFSIRLSFILLGYIYEQVYYTNSIQGKFQDEFIQEVIYGEYKNEEKIYQKAANLKLNIAKSYIAICIQHHNDDTRLHDYREKVAQRIYQAFSKDKVLFGLLNKNTIVILYAVSKEVLRNNKEIKRGCCSIIEMLEKDIPNSQFRGGIGYTVDSIVSIKKGYMESAKAIEIGKYIYPKETIVEYQELGPFGLIRIESFQEGDLQCCVKIINPLLKQDDKDELLSTLKTYLESESNYNFTAKKLFIHSNTVRYRIEKIQQLCNVDLSNPIERLKLEIILKFIN